MHDIDIGIAYARTCASVRKASHIGAEVNHLWPERRYASPGPVLCPATGRATVVLARTCRTSALSNEQAGRPLGGQGNQVGGWTGRRPDMQAVSKEATRQGKQVRCLARWPASRLEQSVCGTGITGW